VHLFERAGFAAASPILPASNTPIVCNYRLKTTVFAYEWGGFGIRNQETDQTIFKLNAIFSREKTGMT
jgi:hypothetical protein